MYSLTANQDDYTRNFNKNVKILIVDEINKVKYEIKYPWIGKISVSNNKMEYFSFNFLFW